MAVFHKTVIRRQILVGVTLSSTSFYQERAGVSKHPSLQITTPGDSLCFPPSWKVPPQAPAQVFPRALGWIT